jgi:O-antigen biosynthesis protein WbqP
MSFIGPRPVIWNQTDIIQKRTDLGVHHLYPGITGLAQAKGCDDSVQEEKIYYDKQYLDHFGIIQDTKIVFETIIIMLKRLKRDDDYE